MNKIKNGILLAGGTGSRLQPFTKIFNKHLYPVNDRFVIDYPLERLREMGVENLTIVLGGNHFDQIVSHVRDGSHLGMHVNYVYQNAPAGIAQAIGLCAPYVQTYDLNAEKGQFITMLGDNIFEYPIYYARFNRAQIFLAHHHELNRFGIASVRDNQIVKIEEKPINVDYNIDNFAITGCYIFDQKYFEYFEKIKPSPRGEFEITDIIRMYLADDKLTYSIIDGMWSDAGTHESIKYVNNFFYEKI